MFAFASAIAEQTGISQAQASIAARAFVDEIVTTLLRDGRVRLDNFGVFEIVTRKGRRGRNPRTGERISIPDKVGIRFRVGGALREVLDRLP